MVSSKIAVSYRDLCVDSLRMDSLAFTFECILSEARYPPAKIQKRNTGSETRLFLFGNEAVWSLMTRKR